MSNEKKDKKQETYNPEITKEDKKALGDKAGNLHTDLSDDELLKEREEAVDFAGSDLDVPGRDLPKNTNHKSLKDEENQMYSQGGPGNEDLENTTEHVK
ncbi:hypothetical protein ESY86_10925 [Subsaximicrobium wynnwilliamsii]|uniref:Uncharacterized protein n=1 Tax=Subsaximicrobium wynnwilliamsii TaxID=291179 RepID=A0A5C6ZHU9_9FLAO|nr:hypothetical protein [Subsaximicrobium wynnwilliamsii]TXD84048.1 hypothetical protein ESY87_05915 [Subsaximicrobium wynnwilliamsii]TXD88994.1 hypothetical protein ESY86_10925 [Subsaximicrobium wynnwilliamsii]TXE03760.1 hypothetical protein ESY88_05910 [Subsaximicrobium wynnwilliamsii]